MSEDIRDQLPAETPRQQRNWMLWGWLAMVVLYNLVALGLLLTDAQGPNLTYTTSEGLFNPAYLPIVVIGRIGVILSSIALALGYRLGFWGLVISFVVTVIGSLLIGFNIASVVEAGGVLLVVWLLVRGMWHRMK